MFYKLNTAELKFGSVLNGTFKADNWITAGNKLETIENCAYLGKDGKIVTGTIEVVEKDGVVGVRANNELPSVIRQLTTKPTYKPLRTIFSKQNKTTTFIGKWNEIVGGQQSGLQKIFSELSETDLNIYMKSGKFDNPGGFNMLSIDDFGVKETEYLLKQQQGLINQSWSFDDYIWEAYNRPWLESALQRGDDIIIWSDPINSRNGFYKRELDFFETQCSKYGYDYNKGISTGTFIK